MCTYAVLGVFDVEVAVLKYELSIEDLLVYRHRVLRSLSRIS